MFLWITIIIIFIPIIIMFPVTIKGQRNIPKKGAVILTCNHTTNNDGVILLERLCRKPKVMAKSELFKHKFGAWFFRHVNAYPVDRGKNDISSIKTTLRYLHDGKAILIFPSGTRLKEVDADSAKNGAALFALKQKCSIVPMAFVKPTKVFRFNTLLIGKPYNLSEMEQFKDKTIDKELLAQASEIVLHQINNLIYDYKEKHAKVSRRAKC